MKRRLSLALALLLAAAQLSLGWAAAPSRPAKPTAKPALVELSGMLKASLPVVAGLPLPAGRKPAALDPQKGAAIVKRSTQIIETAPPAARLGDGGAVNAQAIIRSVNAVLMDFSAQDIEAMPAEDLSAAAGIIMDQMRGQPKTSRADALRGVTMLAQARADRLLTLRGKPVKEILENPGHTENHGDMITVRGAPPQVRMVRPRAEAESGAGHGTAAQPVSRNTVFRHYTDPELLPAILGSRALKNGHMPYTQKAPYTFTKDFADITGLFLTLPTTHRDQVTRPSKAYVDLLLPPTLPLLELEAGKVYLVPLRAQTIDWMLASYLRWINGENVTREELKNARKLDAEGGPGPDLAVPVKIVRHGRVR